MKKICYIPRQTGHEGCSKELTGVLWECSIDPVYRTSTVKSTRQASTCNQDKIKYQLRNRKPLQLEASEIKKHTSSDENLFPLKCL